MCHSIYGGREGGGELYELHLSGGKWAPHLHYTILVNV